MSEQGYDSVTREAIGEHLKITPDEVQERRVVVENELLAKKNLLGRDVIRLANLYYPLSPLRRFMSTVTRGVVRPVPGHREGTHTLRTESVEEQGRHILVNKLIALRLEPQRFRAVFFTTSNEKGKISPDTSYGTKLLVARMEGDIDAYESPKDMWLKTPLEPTKAIEPNFRAQLGDESVVMDPNDEIWNDLHNLMRGAIDASGNSPELSRPAAGHGDMQTT